MGAYFTDDQIDWTRQKNPTPSVFTGPEFDHSGNGSFMYIETSLTQTADKARLQSPTVTKQG